MLCMHLFHKVFRLNAGAACRADVFSVLFPFKFCSATAWKHLLELLRQNNFEMLVGFINTTNGL